MTPLLAAILGGAAGLLIALAARRAWVQRRAHAELDRWRADEADAVAEDARRRSRAVVRGQIAEQVAPFAPETGWDPADARFLGRPIDFVVFDGLADVRAGRADRLREIVVVDVKTGRAALSAIERCVRDAVIDGRVETRVVHPTTAGTIAEHQP